MQTFESKGWLARQQAAKAKLAAGTPDHLAENMRLAEERTRQDRADAEAYALEQEAKRQATLCGCPACKATGEVTEAESAFIASALSYYRSKAYLPDPVYLSRDKLLPRPLRAVSDPVAVARIAQDIAEMDAKVSEAQTEVEALAEVIAAETPKKARRHVVPPHLED